MKRPKAKRRGSPPTIIDVAKAAKVGVMSVSRVINNHPSVKHSTRSRVLRAIAKIGYSPNDAARMLKGRRGRTIGLVVPDLSDFFSSCFHAIQEVAIRHDYQTLVVATGRSVAVEEQQLESIQNRVAGLLIVSSGRFAFYRVIRGGRAGALEWMPCNHWSLREEHFSHG